MADYLKLLSGTKPRVDLFGLTPEQINQVSRTNLATEDQGFSAAGLITKAIEDRVNKGLKERQLKEQERSNVAGETHAAAALKAEDAWREMQNLTALRGQDVTKGYYDTLAEQGRNSNAIASQNAATNARQADTQAQREQRELDEWATKQTALGQILAGGATDLSQVPVGQLMKAGAGVSLSPNRGMTFEEKAALNTAELQRRKAAGDALSFVQKGSGTIADMQMFNEYNNELDQVVVQDTTWTGGTDFRIANLRDIHPNLTIDKVKAIAQKHNMSVDQVVKQMEAEAQAKK